VIAVFRQHREIETATVSFLACAANLVHDFRQLVETVV